MYINQYILKNIIYIQKCLTKNALHKSHIPASRVVAVTGLLGLPSVTADATSPVKAITSME